MAASTASAKAASRPSRCASAESEKGISINQNWPVEASTIDSINNAAIPKKMVITKNTSL